ncbi:MAG: hypothetical protein V2I76_05690 [Roseobacter sp.]|nr:hypothetical protein [Roseobacter sp.]
MEYNNLVVTMRRLSLETGARITQFHASDDFDTKVQSDESQVTEEQAASHSVKDDTFLILDPLDTIGETQPVSVSDADDSALLVVVSISHRDHAKDDAIGRYNVRDMKSAGSWAKLCLVATGAGGHVMRFEGHTPLTYGEARFANPFFVADAAGMHAKAA